MSKRKREWYRKDPWYQLPLRCFVGFHQWMDHPGVPWIKCCTLCNGERDK